MPTPIVIIVVAAPLGVIPRTVVVFPSAVGVGESDRGECNHRDHRQKKVSHICSCQRAVLRFRNMAQPGSTIFEGKW
jgi:hypothetical protein